jgi:polyhydroxyalkanoate synthesis regulator phasin
MSKKSNRDSPLVTSVLALQDHLSELERIGARINSSDLTGDIDVEHIQKLMNHFAACGQGISEEVNNFSRHLQDAQTRAESVAQEVSRQAEVFKIRRSEQNEKLEQFRLLGERVREINSAISVFRGEDRAALASNIPALESQLANLIEDLQEFRNTARSAQMKALAKNAESLTQSLQAVQVKLRDLIR